MHPCSLWIRDSGMSLTGFFRSLFTLSLLREKLNFVRSRRRKTIKRTLTRNKRLDGGEDRVYFPFTQKNRREKRGIRRTFASESAFLRFHCTFRTLSHTHTHTLTTDTNTQTLALTVLQRQTTSAKKSLSIGGTNTNWWQKPKRKAQKDAGRKTAGKRRE